METEMGIMGLRRQLGARIDAAYFHHEPTIIKNEKKNERRAALIPYEWYLILADALREHGIEIPNPSSSDTTPEG